MSKKIKEETGKALKKQSTQLDKMKEANNKMKRQLELAKSGRSEADLGFAKEQELCKALKKAYPGDLVKVVGKGGDVLHSVKRSGKILDTIVYECKEVDAHTSAHVNQASSAKSQRNALFAVLVTTGKTTKNFNGFKVEKNVTVVRPEAVLVIANTLRDQILEIEKLKITESEKNIVANRALKYLNSTSYKTPITTAIKICDDNIKELNKEVRAHFSNWKSRYKNYKSLSANIELLSENSGRAIKGEQLKSLPKANYSINLTIPLLK